MVKKKFFITLFILLVICSFPVFGDDITWGNLWVQYNVTTTNGSFVGDGALPMTCNDTQVASYNGTSGDWECADASTGTGDITDVNTNGDYLTGGAITGSVNLLLNETKLNNTIDVRDSDTTYSAGSNLSLAGTVFSLDTSSVRSWLDTVYQTINDYFTNAEIVSSFVNRSDWTTIDDYPSGCTGSDAVTGLGDTLTCADNWIDDSEESGLNVNSSSYWDNLNVPSDIDFDDLTWSFGDSWNYISSNQWFFNESKLSTTYYNATSATAVDGVVDAGSVNDTKHPDGNFDDVTLNISESAGGPGIDFRINFTDGITGFSQGVMRYKTSTLAGDPAEIQLWDFTNSEWDSFPNMVETLDFRIIEQPVFNDDVYVSNGTVAMRVYKSSNGNTNNHYYIDWLTIADGYAVPAGEEVDPVFGEWLQSPEHRSNVNMSDNNFFGTGSIYGFSQVNSTSFYQGGNSVLDSSDEYLGGLSCADAEIAKYNSTSGDWECESDDSGGSSTQWNITGSSYLYNNSGILEWNESLGNITYASLSGNNNFSGDIGVDNYALHIGDASGGAAIYFHGNSGWEDQTITYDTTLGHFDFSDDLWVTGSFLTSGTINGGDNIFTSEDIYTSGSGDDLWLGTGTQNSSLLRAYANGDFYANGTSTLNNTVINNGLNMTDSNVTGIDCLVGSTGGKICFIS